MKVSELKELIANIPNDYNDFIVVMSKDGEGNGFEELYFIGKKMTDNKSHYYYDPHSNEITHYNDEDYDSFAEYIENISEYEQLKPCIVLWP